MRITTAYILNDLNDSQKKAVMITEGPVLIIAGPGTGKTLTIVRRIAYLIHKGVNPENILAVTFTNRAAREMRERTDNLLGEEAGRVFIGTFHLLGLKIIKEVFVNNFVIYSKEEQMNLIKKLFKDSDTRKVLQEKGINSYEMIAEKISRIKSCMEDVCDESIKRIYEKYQTALTEHDALDFDDLILKPIEILKQSEVSEKYRDTFRYIMVDEYQDINPSQYKLLTLLSHRKGNICAIGDSDQAIYAFRGADVSNFLNFEKDFIDAKRITLNENYRSTGMLLNTSQTLIKNNHKRIDKELSPIREKGMPVNVISVPDEKLEGEIIIKEIEERMGGTSHYQLYTGGFHKGDSVHHAESYRFSDFAVIYRTNAQSKALEDSFTASGIPYQVIGNKYLLRKKELMNILAFLKVIINPMDDFSHHRVLALSKEILNKGTIEKFRGLKNLLPIHELLKVVWEESGIKEYCSEESYVFIEELLTPYRHMDSKEALDTFMNEISLFTPVDVFNSGADAVTLMTLHMAKGLEFKVVFIAGVEEGLIPYRIKKDDIDIEEERRLFYVGITRAMDELFLIYTRNRFLYGQRLTQSPSPFLSEIPEEFIRYIVIPDRTKKPKDPQIGLF
ncbi:MAG: UvrD-helicase domain-containing protein [Nitrospirota bacterium]|nr:UvrD-helicase domain-containing protein [Nitrospirota bacterium]